MQSSLRSAWNSNLNPPVSRSASKGNPSVIKSARILKLTGTSALPLALTALLGACSTANPVLNGKQSELTLRSSKVQTEGGNSLSA
jgi:hypothetical protein